MAATKKTVAAAVATKVEEPKTEVKKAVTPATTTVKTASAKATVKPATAEEKEEVKTETAKKESAKKTPVKKAVKKETTVKKAPVKKAELKGEVHIQFDGKSYSQEDLIQIAKDVWKYDLKQKVGDLTSVELYVKPEENMVYYVMNKEMSGSFYI